MTKKTISLLAAALLIFSNVTSAAEPRIAQADGDLGQKSVPDQVKILRQEQYQKMPYMDRGYIRQRISPDSVRLKRAFTGADSKKGLDEIIARAILVHTPAKASRERIALARRRILVSLRSLFPEANLKITDGKGDLSDAAYNSFNYKVQLKQPIFHGGVLWNTFLQEKSGLEAAQKEYSAIIENLINDVSAAYFEYSRAQQVVSDQQKVIQNMERYVGISQEKYSAEIISEIEHLNTQSLYGQLKYDHETSMQELELAKLDLQKFLDLNPNDNINVKPLYSLEQVLSMEKSSDDSKPAAGNTNEVYGFEGGIHIPALNDLMDMAYQHRPELEVEAAKLESARLEERIRWGEFIPQTDVVVEFGKLGEAYNVDDLHPGLRQEFRVLLEVNWNAAGNKLSYSHEDNQQAPSITQFQSGAGSRSQSNNFQIGVLDGLKDVVQVKEAEVAKLDQVVQLEKVEKEVVYDVKQSYYDYQKARIRVKSSLQRVDYRRRLAALSKHRLEKNEIQISEYLQAELDLLQEVTLLHKALSDYFTAKAKLNHAIGVRNYLAIEDIHGSKTA